VRLDGRIPRGALETIYRMFLKPSFLVRQPPEVSLLAVAFAPDVRTLAIGDSLGRVQLWPVASHADLPRPLTTLFGHTRAVWSVAFAPDGQSLASGSHDGTIKIWKVFEREEHATLRVPGHAVTFALSSGRKLAVADRQGGIWLGDGDTGQEQTVLRGNRGVLSLAFSPDEQTLAIGDKEGIVKLWDLHTGLPWAELPLHEGGINALAFSPEGSLLATAGNDMTVLLWDLQASEVRAHLGEQRELVENMVFSPRGSLLVTASYDWTVRLWDTATGQQRACMEGESGLLGPAEKVWGVV
jgi:WD40 repeat protein